MHFESVFGGTHDMLSRQGSFLDSGLAIFSTWKPIEKGHHVYKHTPKIGDLPQLLESGQQGKLIETMANKGYRWVYFDNRHIDTANYRVGTIVITTHLTTAADYKKGQLKELSELILHKREHFLKDVDILEQYVFVY